MKKEKKNYYEEIDEVLKSYEEYKSYHPKTVMWAADRINWCWKFRKITEEQVEELADRATEIFKEHDNIFFESEQFFKRLEEKY